MAQAAAQEVASVVETALQAKSRIQTRWAIGLAPCSRRIRPRLEVTRVFLLLDRLQGNE
jgi:hypothetical protein